MAITLRQIAKQSVFGTIGVAKRVTAQAEFRRHANGHPLRIMLGAGPHRRDGWVSTDIAIRHPGTVYLNIARRFPLADSSVEAYFLEHVIEHIPFDTARSMLGEIHRTLMPCGIVRIATPDLRRVAGALDRTNNAARSYVMNGNLHWNRRYNAAPRVPEGQIENPCFTVNRMFYHWGHRFIYDQPTLTSLLWSVGFDEIVRCEVGESEHAHMQDLERHGSQIDTEINAFETMVLEASNTGRNQS